MDRGKLGFINIYKIMAAIIIGCFLHYNVFVITPLGCGFEGENRFITFLMQSTSNYLVELFFMMSGILFAFSYQKRIENGSLRFDIFMNKRLYRLLPLAIFTTLFFFPVRVLYEHIYEVPFFPGREYANFNNLISSIFLLNTTLLGGRVNPPAWQISKLIPCYIIAYFLSKLRNKLGFITFFIPIILGLVIQVEGFELPLAEFHISRAYIGFFWGVVLERVLVFWGNSYTTKIRIISKIGGGALIFLPVYLNNLVFDWSTVSIFFIFTGLILIGFSSKTMNNLGSSKILVKLSDISYDLYLWNCPILIVMLFLHKMYGIKINTYFSLLLLILMHFVVGYASSEIRKSVYRIIGERFNALER